MAEIDPWEIRNKNYHPKLKNPGSPLVCARCGQGGGTLVKRENGVYVHQRPEYCRRHKE